jgi:hypothetical protein
MLSTPRLRGLALLFVGALSMAGCSAAGSGTSPIVPGAGASDAADPAGDSDSADAPAAGTCDASVAADYGFDPVALPANWPADIPIVGGPCDFALDLGIGAGGAGNVLLSVAVSDFDTVPTSSSAWPEAQQQLADAGLTTAGLESDSTETSACVRFVADEIINSVSRRDVRICVHRQGQTDYNVIEYDVQFVV